MASICSPGMPRRAFMAVIAEGLLAAPLAAPAQQPGKVYRIAFLGASSPALEAELVASLSPGIARSRLRRGPEHRHRVSLDGRAV